MAELSEARVREIVKADAGGIQMTEDRVREIVKALIISGQDEWVRKIVKAELAAKTRQSVFPSRRTKS